MRDLDGMEIGNSACLRYQATKIDLLPKEVLGKAFWSATEYLRIFGKVRYKKKFRKQ